MNYVLMGLKIREMRKKRGFTLDALATKCKLSASFLGNIERGTRAASLETFVLLCNTLEVSPTYFLKQDLDKHRPPMREGMTQEDYEKVCTLIHLALKTLKGEL